MLLACCFRGPSKKKHKKNKNWKAENAEDDEEFYVLSQSLLSSKKEPITSKKNNNNSKTKTVQDQNTVQERRISSEIHRRLQKEKEELKVQRQSFAENVQVTGIESSSYKNRTNDPTYTNIIKNQLIQQDVSRMFASAEDLEGSLLSLSSAHQSLQISSQSLVPNFDQETNQDEVVPDQPTQDDHHKIETEEVPQNKDAVYVVEVENVTKQIEKNEKDIEYILRNQREEFEKTIKDMKHQHEIELDKVKESYDAKFAEIKADLRRDLERANIEAKNATNETISNLNKQIIQERGKILTEQQENSKQLQEEFRLKTEQLNQSFKDIEKRELAWQEEKQEVLNEVQRLKADATRMAKLLAMEYEEETSHENKKRSLSQEVYSLQLVVEMRTGEVRNLREQMAKATQQLEQAQMDKEKLRKVTARMEDLEEQLRIKTNVERQLSLEKSQLETEVANSTREADRMSKTMESLRWRIQNNFQFPPETISPVASGDRAGNQRPTTECITASAQSTSVAEISQDSLVIVDKKLELSQRTAQVAAISSDAIRQLDDKENKTAESVEDHIDDLINDVDSLDEGVGDISSDGENHDRLSIDNTNDRSFTNEENIVECDKEAIKEKKNISQSHEKERIPSIF